MQTASIMLALGGDTGNTVPKANVTPAEVAVLQFLHGNDAVSEIQPTGEIKRSSRDERQRLLETYGRQADGRFTAPAVDALFPGVAARVFEDFSELDLDESLFAAERRVKADPLDHDANGKKGGTKAADPASDVDTMTKAQLVEYAKANNIDVDANAKKDDVLTAIKAAEKPKLPVQDDEIAEDDGIGEMEDKNLFK